MHNLVSVLWNVNRVTLKLPTQKGKIVTVKLNVIGKLQWNKQTFYEIDDFIEPQN